MAAESKTITKLDTLFSKISLKSFPSVKVVSVPSNATVAETLEVLSNNKILCAPVVDASKKSDSWLDKYLGLVDMADIVSFALSKVEVAKAKSKGFAALVKEAKEFSTHQVKDILDSNGHNPFVPLALTSSMRDAMLLLGKHHLYRIIVIDAEKEELANIITQSAMVKVLGDNMKSFGDFGKKTLTQLGLAQQKTIFSVALDNLAIDAFKLMLEKKVGAVPVLGVNGQLVGNISVRDIRTAVAKPEMWSTLFEPMSKFIGTMRADSDDIMSPAISCNAGDTLAQVIGKLCTSRIHRVYVVDEKAQLTTVVSLSDIISVFVSEPDDKDTVPSPKDEK
jgi:CBS domain-containing protein